MNRRQVLTVIGGTVGCASDCFAEPTNLRLLKSQWDLFTKDFFKNGYIWDDHVKAVHSEGIGLGLLVSQELTDWKSFKSLFQISLRMRREDGLYSWKWSPTEGIIDAYNATDGDIYIAWGLFRAWKKLNDPQLLTIARNTVIQLLEKCVVLEKHGLILIPGLEGFSPPSTAYTVVNPSYWIFPALIELKSLLSGANLKKLEDLILNMEKFLSYSYFGKYRLPSDWVILTDPVTPWKDRPTRFSYDAIRIPLFLKWGGLTESTALKNTETFFKTTTHAWVDVVSNATSPYPRTKGLLEVSKYVLGQPPSRPVAYEDYYSHNLKLLTLLARLQA